MFTPRLCVLRSVDWMPLAGDVFAAPTGRRFLDFVQEMCREECRRNFVANVEPSPPSREGSLGFSQAWQRCSPNFRYDAGSLCLYVREGARMRHHVRQDDAAVAQELHRAHGQLLEILLESFHQRFGVDPLSGPWHGIEPESLCAMLHSADIVLDIAYPIYRMHFARAIAVAMRGRLPNGHPLSRGATRRASSGDVACREKRRRRGQRARFCLRLRRLAHQVCQRTLCI